MAGPAGVGGAGEPGSGGEQTTIEQKMKMMTAWFSKRRAWDDSEIPTSVMMSLYAIWTPGRASRSNSRRSDWKRRCVLWSKVTGDGPQHCGDLGNVDMDATMAPFYLMLKNGLRPRGMQQMWMMHAQSSEFCEGFLQVVFYLRNAVLVTERYTILHAPVVQTFWDCPKASSKEHSQQG